MRRSPTCWTIWTLYGYLSRGGNEARIDGVYVPARPLGFDCLKQRIRCAWMVFTGRADAVIWPGQES